MINQMPETQLVNEQMNAKSETENSTHNIHGF